MANRVPERFNIPDRRAGLRWIPARIVDCFPDDRRSLVEGDVLQGAVAAAALLVIWAIGLAPWLAILLSVMTYMGIALIRPTPEDPAESVDSTATESPVIVVMSEGDGREHPPDGDLSGIEAVADCYRLTRREREILPLLAHRFTDREIAEQLSISHRTAMNHTSNILRKLDLESRREVAPLISRQAVLSASVPPHEPE